MGNQVVKPEPEQDNDRIIDTQRWAYLQPFYPYIEDQIKSDAMRIENTYETVNFTIFSSKDTLRINLNVIPKEELAKLALTGEMYSPLEKYISYDKSVSDSEASIMAVCKCEGGIPAEYATIISKDLYARIEKKTDGKSVLPIDLTNASILLSQELRLNLIRKYFTKPYSISGYDNDKLTITPHYMDGRTYISQSINVDANLVLSWIRIPNNTPPSPTA